MICVEKREYEDHNSKKIKLPKKIGYFLYNIYILIAKGFHLFIKPRPLKVKLYGKSFYVLGNMEYILFWSLFRENNTYKIFNKFLDADHSYLDVGAFIGSTVLYGADIAKKVYAIEPDPIAFKVLEKNVSLNPKLKEKIELHKKCINFKSGKVRFGNWAKGGDSISSLNFADSKTSWIVEGINFNEFIRDNKINDCNFIKMDIEGGESIVLPSMKNYLKRNKPVLYLSMHPIFFGNPEEDTRRIIDVLKVYKNFFTNKGKKIELYDLLSKKRLRGRYAIIATD